MPDTDPQLKQVILYRLDNLDRNVGRLVTTDQFYALERRVSNAEEDIEERDRWMRQLTASVFIALLSGLISLAIAVYVNTGGI